MANPSANSPTRGPSAMQLMLAAVILAAVSIWAFTEDTGVETSAAGVRVDPNKAYNPVTAGERLPDGFRQLLPRDAIRPVYDPQFVPSSWVDWPDATDVIGVEVGGATKAYPVSFLTGRELVVDQLDGVPILVSW